ncbi:DUF308 domain-containing protein [[Eubacterium] cellulosolvens]
MSTEKSSKWMRTLDIILGVIAIIFAGYILINPTVGALTINFIISLAVLVLGIALILGSRSLTKTDKAKPALTGAGILMVILAIVTFVYPGITVTLLIALIAIAMLIMGVAVLVNGIYGKNNAHSILGIIILILAIIVIAYPAVGQYWLVIMLAATLALGGLSRLAAGITGK